MRASFRNSLEARPPWCSPPSLSILFSSFPFRSSQTDQPGLQTSVLYSHSVSLHSVCHIQGYPNHKEGYIPTSPSRERSIRRGSHRSISLVSCLLVHLILRVYGWMGQRVTVRVRVIVRVRSQPEVPQARCCCCCTCKISLVVLRITPIHSSYRYHTYIHTLRWLRKCKGMRDHKYSGFWHFSEAVADGLVRHFATLPNLAQRYDDLLDRA